MKHKKQPLIPGSLKEQAKQFAVKGPQPQSLELLLLQFNDHIRNVSKSLSAMGDIATLMYNEVAARDKALQAKAEEKPPAP